MLYKIEFNINKEDFIDNIEVEFCNQDGVISTEIYDTSIIKIEKCEKEITYNNENLIYINQEGLLYDDFHKVAVYLNNNLLGDDKYSFDKNTKYLSLSYKLNLTTSDVIKIEYYKEHCVIEYNSNVEVQYVNVKCNYKKSYLLGSHTNN